MENCLFCKIAAGQIPSTKVYEDDQVLAFRDIAPQAPTHVLVIPKKHVTGWYDAKDESDALLAHLMRTAAQVAKMENIVDNGFQDGTFYIQQKTMVADFQFYDFIEHTTPRMESVDLSLNNEQPFHVEVNDG